MRGLALFAIGLAFMVSGCACTCRVKPEFVFDCGNGRDLKVEYVENADAMRIEYSGEVFRLPRAISASGARYSDGRVTFWEKGGTAFLERDGRIVEQKCVLQNPKRP